MSDAFLQKNGAGVQISASTTSASSAIDPGCHYLRIVNGSTGSIAYVVTAKGSAPTATSAGFPVAPLGSAVMKINPEHDYMAVVLNTGTTTIAAVPGKPLT